MPLRTITRSSSGSGEIFDGYSRDYSNSSVNGHRIEACRPGPVLVPRSGVGLVRDFEGLGTDSRRQPDSAVFHPQGEPFFHCVLTAFEGRVDFIEGGRICGQKLSSSGGSSRDSYRKREGEHRSVWTDSSPVDGSLRISDGPPVHKNCR